MGAQMAIPLFLVMPAIVGMNSMPANAKTDQATQFRDIQEFVDAQGTFDIGILFLPPIQNFIGFCNNVENPDDAICASVDYAGLADLAECDIGEVSTEFAGTVIQRELDDGRAEVTVLLHTSNALTWVIEGPNFFNPDALVLFGQRPFEIVEGNEECELDDGFALGNSFLQVVFINPTPEADLPDLIQLLFFPDVDQEVIFLAIRAQAAGELREGFDEVDDGTPGKVTVVQNGFFLRGSGMGALEDGFPVENIMLGEIEDE